MTVGKKRKCKQCKEYFVKTKPLQYICSPKCAIEYGKKTIETQEKKEWNRRKKQIKDSLKTRTDYEKDLQVVINAIARKIDEGSVCMMHGGPITKKKNACHYHSQGGNPALRFNLLNIWLGCEKCNSHLGGNIPGYDIQLVDGYGKEKWEFIKFDLVRIYPTLKLTEHELVEKIALAKKILKKLQLMKKKKRTLGERWALREEINYELGIY